MRIYHGTEEYASEGHRSDVALGYFDGVHEGHRAVIRLCTAFDSGAVKAVLTFTESPAAALGRPTPPALTDNEEKARLLEALGVEVLILEDFSAIRRLSADEFVGRILRDRLRARSVTCGYNYRFGKGGEGDCARLSSLCAQEGIAVKVAAPVFVMASFTRTIES